MMFILLIGAFAYILSKITRLDTSLTTVDSIIKETHVYSGVDERTYRAFLALIQIAKEYRTDVKFSQIYLEKALKMLNDIPLYMSPMDVDVMNELGGISYRLGYEFEQLLMKEALNQQIEFNPKYI
jgi:hypothetical protein|tara:strand:- start:459 stop:836 length:378 start_codon:yes stop_codon:yes gene_type:complete